MELVVHTTTNANVIKILRREERQGFKHLFDGGMNEWITDYIKMVSEQELEWCKYLFKDGNVPGFTQEVGEMFIKVYTDKALTNLGYEPLYNEKKTDIIEWYEMYRNSNKKNIAAQEQQQVNYQKGTLKNDFQSTDWSEFLNTEHL